MSSLAACAHYETLYFPGSDHAQSVTARDLKPLVTGEALAPSHSWLEQRPTLGALAINRAVQNAAVTHGITVTPRALDVAVALMWVLPSHVPMPEVIVEEDGTIAFDWHEGSDRVVTVTVNGNGYLGYAALVGLRPDYGRAPFGGSIPDTILFNLLRVYPLPASRSQPA